MQLCKNLNYLRSFLAGRAAFYYLDETKTIRPITIDQTRLRTTRAGYAEMYTGDNLERKSKDQHALATANIHLIEECYVPFGVDEVYCRFSLRIQPNAFSPEVCVNEEIKNTLKQLVASFHELEGFHDIAKRISKNILMGKWLWRNRECRALTIHIDLANGEKITLENANALTWGDLWEGKAANALTRLTDYILAALTKHQAHHYMDITAIMNVGWGDELFPSQEFINEKRDGVPSKQLSRTLLEDGSQTAAFHSQKIGAALQSIDDWYADNAEYPLRVNEYGSDRQSAVAKRHPLNNNDFYQLIVQAEEWITHMEEQKTIPSEVYFIVSVLVKGGLFNCGKE